MALYKYSSFPFLINVFQSLGNVKCCESKTETQSGNI